MHPIAWLLPPYLFSLRRRHNFSISLRCRDVLVPVLSLESSERVDKTSPPLRTSLAPHIDLPNHVGLSRYRDALAPVLSRESPERADRASPPLRTSPGSDIDQPGCVGLSLYWDALVLALSH